MNQVIITKRITHACQMQCSCNFAITAVAEACIAGIFKPNFEVFKIYNMYDICSKSA